MARKELSKEEKRKKLTISINENMLKKLKEISEKEGNLLKNLKKIF